MRYNKAERLIQLALEMQAAHGGLTIADIMERMQVSRRTAIRMRDAVLRAFPDADQVSTDERAKRWRLVGNAAGMFARVNADELASLETAAQVMDRDNLVPHAETLRLLSAKLRAQLPDNARRSVEPDLEALMEAEGLALRPGPRAPVADKLLLVLREAIKGCRRIRFHYSSRMSGQQGERTGCPLGLLYGHRHYLVADLEDGVGPRYFSLPSIGDVELLPGQFVRDPDFQLTALLEQSFGIFRETPTENIWRFSVEAAPLAAEFQFHASQTSRLLDDGRLEVRFMAGGMLEMAWHLLTWGRHVEVVAPQALRDLLPDTLPEWPALP